MSLLNSMTPTDLSNAIPQHWDAKVRLDAARKSFWGKFVGKEGSDMPIIERADFTTEPGNQINIQIASQLLQEGQTGDSTLENNEEKLSLAQITITPNVLRHAVAVNWRAKKQANFNTIQAAGNTLSSWLARRLDEDLWVELLTTHAPASLFAGNAANQTGLGSGDEFGVEEINRMKAALQRQGALPIRTVMDGKQEIDWYGIVISEIDEYQLKLDPVWNTSQQNAGNRGEKNRLFSGALGYWNGVWVFTHTAVKFGGRLGSALRPECQVSTALTAGATTLTVGTNANVNYTKWFPSTGGTILIDQEQISFSGKTNATLSGLTRGVNGTTPAAHSANALVTLNNVSYAVGFGAEIQARAWGLYPTRITNVRDYGYEQGIGIMGYYGQRAIEDSQGNRPNSVVMNCYSPNPNATV